MADTYGEPGKNPYPIPGIVGQYSNVVNASTGITQVYQKSSQFQYTSIGTYNPLTKKFTPDSNANLSEDTIQILSNSSNAQNAIRDAAIKTATVSGLSQTNAQQLIIPNTAPPQEQGGAAEGSTPPPPDLTTEGLALLSKGIPGRPPRNNYGELYYPKDIGSTQSDIIKFTMIRYGTKTYDTETFGFGSRTFNETDQEKEIKGTVIMSVQPTISDYNSVNWSGETMGMLAQAGSQAGLSAIEEGNLSGVIDKIKNTAKLEPGLANAVVAALAQEASGAKGLLTRLTGAMFNNNLELLFMGPQLRQFTFNFKMSPRYKEEADDVRKIIRFFKQGSAVQRSTTNLFLKSPNVFKIEYKNRGPNGEDHKSLNRIKTCALVNVGVDYTPSGSYMTYEEDGSMVSYNLSLTFNELEPVYEDEYGDLDGKINDSAGIGY